MANTFPSEDRRGRLWLYNFLLKSSMEHFLCRSPGRPMIERSDDVDVWLLSSSRLMLSTDWNALQLVDLI